MHCSVTAALPHKEEQHCDTYLKPLYHLNQTFRIRNSVKVLSLNTERGPSFSFLLYPKLPFKALCSIDDVSWLRHVSKHQEKSAHEWTWEDQSKETGEITQVPWKSNGEQSDPTDSASGGSHLVRIVTKWKVDERCSGKISSRSHKKARMHHRASFLLLLRGGPLKLLFPFPFYWVKYWGWKNHRRLQDFLLVDGRLPWWVIQSLGAASSWRTTPPLWLRTWSLMIPCLYFTTRLP